MARTIGPTAATARWTPKATCGGSRKGCATRIELRRRDLLGALRSHAARGRRPAARQAPACRRDRRGARREPARALAAPARAAPRGPHRRRRARARCARSTLPPESESLLVAQGVAGRGRELLGRAARVAEEARRARRRAAQAMIPGDQASAMVSIAVAPEEAFRFFTERIETWWRRG